MSRLIFWKSRNDTAYTEVNENHPYPVQIITVPDGLTADATHTFANVAASQTDQVLVSAVYGKRIRVLQLVMLAGATATNVTFNSKPTGSGTAISIQYQLAANGGAVMIYNTNGWFAPTNIGEGLSVTTGAGSTVGIQLIYAVI